MPRHAWPSTQSPPTHQNIALGAAGVTLRAGAASGPVFYFNSKTNPNT
ncbi:hypothetical protein L195_g034305 [Trifolium pratense]|uniref:Uncharacterized protein n=1 Tax=Trifolium pratense TaxID=57577 RepID=A0A2K3LIH2_TRIPR|nr:hypothetical protein L195_g034305 [Trifolium pratense]